MLTGYVERVCVDRVGGGASPVVIASAVVAVATAFSFECPPTEIIDV